MISRHGISLSAITTYFDATVSSHNKKLVLINQDAGYLFIDIANAALSHYSEVILMSGSITELGSNLDNRVKVTRIFRYRRGSLISRLTSWLLGFAQVVWLLRTRFGSHEVVASSNPPLNTLLPLFIRSKSGLYVLDLYPEALHKTGMISENNLIVRWWARLNSTAYRHFSTIWALTPSMKTSIEEAYGVKTELAPAWACEMGTDTDRSFLDKAGLAGAWVVLYSGNLGREHDVEALLECAARLSDCEDLIFVIAGQGWKRKKLQNHVTTEGLSNVRFLPKLPAPEFSALLSHAQIGVVTQSLRTADVCIPSKTFNLLANGLPILGIGKPDSDFGQLIEKSGSGHVFLPDQTDGMSRFILTCWEENAAVLGYRRNALHTAGNFTRSNADQLVDQFAIADTDG